MILGFQKYQVDITMGTTEEPQTPTSATLRTSGLHENGFQNGASKGLSQIPEYKIQIVWLNVLKISYIHLAAAYGIYLVFTEASRTSLLYTFIFGYMTNLGVAGGAHRMWTHRSYKAKLPLRLFYGLMQTCAGQNSIYDWCRDHRVHHKYTETDADPHNAARGFFFSHVGWLMCKKHPEVTNKGKKIDLSDLWADPIVRLQHQFYTPLVTFCCFILPGLIPYYGWNETGRVSIFVCIFLRLTLSLNFTWTINSVTHIWGNQPYDTTQGARENYWVNIYGAGEGYHNFHHTFPYDYSATEHGWIFNFTGFFIDCMAAIGQVYDRKTASPEVVQRRKERSGERDELGY